LSDNKILKYAFLAVGMIKN